MTDSNTFETVVFDLDGTLVDSASDLQAALNALLAYLEKDPLNRETVIGFIGNGVEMLVRRGLAHSEIDSTDEEFAERLALFKQHYDQGLVNHTKPYDGVMPMLEAISGRGIGIGICTNKPVEPAREISAAMGFSPFLSCIVGGDSLGVKKPDPAPLLHAIEKLGGMPEKTLYVGDSETDYLTARNAGVPFAFFEGGYQRTVIEEFDPHYRVGAMSDIAGIMFCPRSID